MSEEATERRYCYACFMGSPALNCRDCAGAEAKTHTEWKATQQPDPLTTWSDEDKAWLETIPQQLRFTATRYARKLFSVVMQCGAAHHALQLILGSRPPKHVAEAALMLSQTYNNMVNIALGGLGIKDTIFNSCREDIERVAALMDDGKGGRKTPGGIILTS